MYWIVKFVHQNTKIMISKPINTQENALVDVKQSCQTHQNMTYAQQKKAMLRVLDNATNISPQETYCKYLALFEWNSKR